ncbi:MAG: hypothetical protein DMG38_23855 [Acidobacteria bacterium]|nr:MAG: hypothetical protein DMG38_23855 [Acidobacteriota bacterium]
MAPPIGLTAAPDLMFFAPVGFQPTITRKLALGLRKIGNHKAQTPFAPLWPVGQQRFRIQIFLADQPSDSVHLLTWGHLGSKFALYSWPALDGRHTGTYDIFPQ